MHYGDKEHLAESRLIVVVYKHEIMGVPLKRNKRGLVSKRCVDYEVASIQECKMINTRTIKKLLSDPYSILSKSLDHVPNEEWVLVKIKEIDGWDKLEITPIEIVSEHPNESYRLH
jgi:hypothetical protein